MTIASQAEQAQSLPIDSDNLCDVIDAMVQRTAASHRAREPRSWWGGETVRGCLRKAKTQKRGLPPAVSSDGTSSSRWAAVRTASTNRSGFGSTARRSKQIRKCLELVGEVYRGEFIEPSELTLGEWLDACARDSHRSSAMHGEHLPPGPVHSRKSPQACARAVPDSETGTPADSSGCCIRGPEAESAECIATPHTVGYRR